LLTATKVDTFYGKSHILNDVNFTLHDNEIIALLGRNGAGKSTLLKTLIGIAPASNGSIRLAETELIGNSSAQNARLGIGYVPQGRGLFAGMSVEQNLELGGLKRQTGNGVHWTASASTNISRGFANGSTARRIICPAASSKWSRSPAPFQETSGSCCSTSPSRVWHLRWSSNCSRRSIGCARKSPSSSSITISTWRWHCRTTTVALERGRVIHQGPSKALRDDLDLRRKVLWL
jgi:ABC-type sugar transport system ATPase subunit